MTPAVESSMVNNEKDGGQRASGEQHFSPDDHKPHHVISETSPAARGVESIITKYRLHVLLWFGYLAGENNYRAHLDVMSECRTCSLIARDLWRSAAATAVIRSSGRWNIRIST